MPLGDALAVEPALPLAHSDLDEAGLDAGRERQAPRQRGRRLGGPAQRRDDDRVEMEPREPEADRFGLFLAEQREGRVTAAVDEREPPLGVCRGGLAMSHEEDLRRRRGPLEPDLAVAARVRGGGHASRVSSTVTSRLVSAPPW